MDGMKRKLTSLSLVAGFVLLGGCQSKLQQERDELWSQNVELQDQLTSTRSSFDSLQSKHSVLLDENRELRLSYEGARGGGAEPLIREGAVGVNTGFEGIPNVETLTSAGSITVRVPGDVLFRSGKVALKSEAKRTLDQIASVIRSDYVSNRIRIEGYTDTDPIRKSKWNDNLELSVQRAAAVHRFLQSKGIDPGQMYAAGFGEWHPRGTKSKSRRVEIVVVLEE